MKATKMVSLVGGVVVGLSAAFITTGCDRVDDSEETTVSADQSTGVPEEVAEEVDVITKRLMRDSLSEAGLRVHGVTEEGTVSADRSTGIPEEVADQIDAVARKLEAEAESEAGLRVKEGKKDGGARPATAPNAKTESSGKRQPESNVRPQ